VILLDTHVVVWAKADVKRLSGAALHAIQQGRREGGLAISAISVWELASLVARGRIEARGTVQATVSLLIEGTAIQSITPEIAVLATEFPADYPRDPADRLIGATARAHGMALITHDIMIRRSSMLHTIW
jgi:PIN domain nuclease of toxin-antitoxin system